jgi:hypothetical protein
MSEAASSEQASLLLAGSLVLYPIVGSQAVFNSHLTFLSVWPAHGSIETWLHGFHTFYYFFIPHITMLRLACPATVMDQNTAAGDAIVWGRAWILYSYVIQPTA